MRALSFAKHLPEHGWDVTVITPEEGVYGRDTSLEFRGIPGVEVCRTGSWEPAVLLRKVLGDGVPGGAEGGRDYVEEAPLGALGRGLRGLTRRLLYFPDSSRGWIGPAVAEATRLHGERPFDLVLSSSPPVSAHVAAHRFAHRHGVPWVADWRDPWTAHMDTADGRFGRARRLERGLLRDADALVVAWRGLVGLLEDLGRLEEASVVVRNGFEPEDFVLPTDASTGGAFEILHAGTVYGRDQDLDGFLEALSRMASTDSERAIRLRFLGKVDSYTRGRVEARGLGDRVEFDGFASHEETVKAMRRADLLLLLTWFPDTPIGRAICPAKTYEYLAARRPILALAGPGNEAAGLLGKWPGAVVKGFTDVDGIESALRASVQGDGTDHSVPDGSLAPFTRASQAAVLAGVLDKTLAAAVAR